VLLASECCFEIQKNKGDLTFDQVISIAERNVRIKGQADEYRLEMLELLKKAKALKNSGKPSPAVEN
jgi:hypothetical protein